MSDLIEFLNARLDEDEQVAREAVLQFPIEWAVRELPEIRWLTRYHEVVSRQLTPQDGKWTENKIADCGAANIYPARHIALHDPARVLREVESKRQIIDEHALMWRDIGWQEDENGERVEVYAEVEVCATCVEKHSHFGSRSLVPEGTCKTVRLLALPFSDHPDYREEWKP